MSIDNFNPAYSTVKGIFLGGLNIFNPNPQCIFERFEVIESVSSIVPNGALIVRDTVDIINFIN